ncbi:hypothetical protein MASR2M15_29620 [Anaerolineales bacterium]
MSPRVCFRVGTCRVCAVAVMTKKRVAGGNGFSALSGSDQMTEKSPQTSRIPKIAKAVIQL